MDLDPQPTARNAASDPDFRRVRTVGVVLLAVWAAWWGWSLRSDVLYMGERTWGLPLPQIGGDFRVSIDHAARVLASGRDPYRADWVCLRYPYPPFVTRAFAWVVLVRPRAAFILWTLAQVGILAAGVFAALRFRDRNGLTPIPFALALALVLWSSPVLFALERGQCDSLAIPALIAGSMLLARGAEREDWLAGGLFALAAWVKYYPGLAVLSLVACRRWRALGSFVVVGLAVGLADPSGVKAALGNAHHAGPPQPVTTASGMIWTAHSLTTYWAPTLVGTPLAGLAAIPGTIAGTALVLAGAWFVSYRVGRSPDPVRLVFPLALWLVSAATFILPGSADYNLIFLPLAAVALNDPRDRPRTQFLLLLGLLALQPYALPRLFTARLDLFHMSLRVVFLLKVSALLGTGAALATRARQDGKTRAIEDVRSRLPAPHAAPSPRREGVPT